MALVLSAPILDGGGGSVGLAFDTDPDSNTASKPSGPGLYTTCQREEDRAPPAFSTSIHSSTFAGGM